jgi:hypothetical protein
MLGVPAVFALCIDGNLIAAQEPRGEVPRMFVVYVG